MPSVFSYSFVQRAFLVGFLLAVILACIGVVVVLKRLSMIGDALSHASMAGVASGLAFGWNPILGAVISCVCAALGIEAICRKIPKYSEISALVIMTAGVGLAGILSGFSSSAANFNSFLFGSIVAITDFELYLTIGISAAVFGLFLLLYKELFAISFDEESARLSGMPVRLVSTIFTILTAVAISVAARTIGALIVSSLMVIPVACALQVAKGYRGTVILSVIFGVLFTGTGLVLTCLFDLRSGAAIALTCVAGLLIIIAVKAAVKGVRGNRAR